MHIRQALRDTLITTLTGLTTTGSNVYASRVYALGAVKLPCLGVFVDNETVNYATLSLPRTQARKLNVKVEAYCKGTTGYDNTLDTICAEVETAIYGNHTLGGNAEDVKIVSFDAQFAGEGDQPVAVATMILEIVYHTTEGSPTV